MQKTIILNQEHPNITVLKKFNPANIAEAADILTKDVVFHYFNSVLPDLEGDYFGMRGFQDFFRKIGGLSGGTFKLEPILISAMGDELVVTHVKDTMLLKGKQMEIHAVVVWRIVDGKITEA